MLQSSFQPPVVPSVNIGENTIFIFEGAKIAGGDNSQNLRLPKTTQTCEQAASAGKKARKLHCHPRNLTKTNQGQLINCCFWGEGRVFFTLSQKISILNKLK